MAGHPVKETSQIKRRHEITALATNSRGLLAFAVCEGTLGLWDITSGLVRDSQIPTDFVEAMAFLADDRLAVGDGAKHSVSLWNLSDEVMTHQLKGHEEWLRCIAVLTSGHLVSCGDDRIIRLWNPNTGELLDNLDTDTKVTTILGVADGSLVAGDAMGRIHWVDVVL